jgi:hypothetical protein
MEELSLHRRDDIRMRPPMRKKPITTEPVYILTPEYILKYRTVSLPFCRCPHTSLSDRFPIIQPSFIEVF